MSEEERKAIELLKQEPDFSLSYYKREHAIDIVLKLVEKQQKEIEEFEQRLDDEIERCDSICVNCSFREEFCKELVENRQCVPRNGSTNYNKNKGEII